MITYKNEFFVITRNCFVLDDDKENLELLSQECTR